MGAGASTQGQPGSPKKPRSPKRGPDHSKVLTAPDNECEEFEVYYCEWGELGLTLRDQHNSHLVVRVSEKSAALGAKVGSILLSVNEESVTTLPHAEMLQKVAGAEWPKTLRFKIHKEFTVVQDNINNHRAGKMATEGYTVSFNEPNNDTELMGMTLLPLAEEGKEASMTVSECKDPAVSRGITVGSKLLSINGKPTGGLAVDAVREMWVDASWPRTLEFFGSRPIEINSVSKSAKSRVGQPAGQSHVRGVR
jgi:hypothetical protein